jgi:hypothetical protein
MRIALFTPYLPYPPDNGGKIRSFYLLRALTERFDVDLYTPYYGTGPSEDHVEALGAYCRRVVPMRLVRPWRFRNRIKHALSPLPRAVHYFHTADSLKQAGQCLQEEEYDAIIADEICMTPYAELRADVPRLVTRQKVDSAHYREVARARPWGIEKALDFIEAAQLKSYCKKKMSIYQAYLACSENDAAQISANSPGVPALVIPNGADLSKFVPSGGPRAEEPTLLYVGSMNYYPNIDAMQFFFEKAYDRIAQAMPDIQVQIVGHKPPSKILKLARQPGVKVTGTVPNVWPFYDKATVFFVPLRLGSGTRLKIVEAMAMGLPVVSTSVGAEGLDIAHGENILIADDADSFSDYILALLADPDLRARIAAGGQQLAQRYDWMEITKPWAELVEEVASQRKGTET